MILAREQLGIMTTNAEFLQLMAQAYADDRHAFDRLTVLRSSDNPEIRTTAILAVSAILDSMERNYLLAQNNLTPNWKGIGIDPDTNSLQQLEAFYGVQDQAVRKHLLDYVAKTDRYSKRDRFDFVVMVLQHDDHLSMVNQACEIMDHESKLGVNVLAANRYVVWWQENRSKSDGTNTVELHP